MGGQARRHNGQDGKRRQGRKDDRGAPCRPCPDRRRETPRPRVPRLTYEDVTSEKLGKALATEWPSGGIFSSEGGAVLGGHSMGKDAIGRTLALLNKLWDGAPHIVDRATAPSFAVRGARMTISFKCSRMSWPISSTVTVACRGAAASSRGSWSRSPCRCRARGSTRSRAICPSWALSMPASESC